jgi:hypothetical protein
MVTGSFPTRDASASVRTVCQASVRVARASFIAGARGSGASHSKSFAVRPRSLAARCHQRASRKPKSTSRNGKRAAAFIASRSRGLAPDDKRVPYMLLHRTQLDGRDPRQIDSVGRCPAETCSLRLNGQALAIPMPARDLSSQRFLLLMHTRRDLVTLSGHEQLAQWRHRKRNKHAVTAK